MGSDVGNGDTTAAACREAIRVGQEKATTTAAPLRSAGLLQHACRHALSVLLLRLSNARSSPWRGGWGGTGPDGALSPKTAHIQNTRILVCHRTFK